MAGTLPVPAPTVTKESARFWAALDEGRFVLDRCASCGTVVWYPRADCPACHSGELVEIEASGRGTIYSYTVNYRGEGHYRDLTGYVLAYVELEEGPRVVTNIVGAEPDEVQVGSPVELVVERGEEGAVLYRFRLAR